MTTKHNGHVRLHAISRTPRGRLELDPGPAFMTDPARGCAPGKVAPGLFVSDDEVDRAAAKVVCQQRCPFRARCLNYALEHGDRFGVWGGVDMGNPHELGALGYRRHKAKPDVAATARATRLQARLNLEQQVRELHAQGLSDAAIALKTGQHPRNVSNVRTRLRLPALYGPGGKPLNRERVSA